MGLLGTPSPGPGLWFSSDSKSLFSASSCSSRRPFVERGAHPVHAQTLCVWGEEKEEEVG